MPLLHFKIIHPLHDERIYYLVQQPSAVKTLWLLAALLMDLF